MNRSGNSLVQLTLGATWRHNQVAGSEPVSAVAARLVPIRWADTTVLGKLLDIVWNMFIERRQIRVRSHMASFEGSVDPFVFITITNVSRSRALEVTHVYVDTEPQVSATPAQRPLPVRLEPDATWETWIPLSEIPQAEVSSVHDRGRVRLSTGRVAKSKHDSSVPESGWVPG
jgi:hypothetical protein